MLVGTPPFRGTSLHELLTLHVSRPAPVTQLARLPASLQAVVARLLVKDPDGRFANAAALVKALGRCRTRIENGADEAAESRPASELETAVARFRGDGCGARAVSTRGWEKGSQPSRN